MKLTGYGRPRRQNVEGPSGNQTIGAGWWHRVFNTLDWLINKRPAWRVYRVTNYFAPAAQSLSANQVTEVGFNAAVDVGNMLGADDGAQSFTGKIRLTDPKGWWLISGRVKIPYDSTVGPPLTAALINGTGDRFFAEIVIKSQGGSEWIVDRDELLRWVDVGGELRPSAIVDLFGYDTEDVNVALRVYSFPQEYNYDAELSAIHLTSHTTDTSYGALGTSSYAAATRWTSGQWSSTTHGNSVRNAIQFWTMDRPAFTVFADTFMPIANNTLTTFSIWTSFASDPRGYLVSGSTINIEDAGWWVFDVHLSWPEETSPSGQSHHAILIYQNSTVIAREDIIVPGSATVMMQRCSAFANCTVGDDITVQVYHYTAGGPSRYIGTLWAGLASTFQARFNGVLVKPAAENATDSRSLTAGPKAVNDQVTYADYNNFPDAINWHMRSRPAFYATMNSTFTTTSATPRSVPFTTPVLNSASGLDLTVGNYRFVAPVTGWYVLMACVGMNVTTRTDPTQLAVWFRKNGSEVIGRREKNGLWLNLQIPPTPVYLSAGDYVQLWLSHSSTAGTETWGQSTVAANTPVVFMAGWFESDDVA